MEIEKDFYIRVDRVTDNSSVSLQSSANLLKCVFVILTYLVMLLSCSMITNALYLWGIFRLVSLSAVLISMLSVNVCHVVLMITFCVCLEINELTFRRHFEECGTVEAVRLVRDQNSGLGKGFGYVLFEVRCLRAYFTLKLVFSRSCDV